MLCIPHANRDVLPFFHITHLQGLEYLIRLDVRHVHVADEYAQRSVATAPMSVARQSSIHNKSSAPRVRWGQL